MAAKKRAKARSRAMKPVPPAIDDGDAMFVRLPVSPTVAKLIRAAIDAAPELRAFVERLKG